MKRILKLFIPPILLKIFSSRRKDSHPEITYSGIYQTFDEAKADFTFGGDYHSDQSFSGLKDCARQKFQRLSNGQSPHLDWDNARYNLFTAFMANQSSKEKMTILDIGGGFGDSFIDLKFACPKLKVEYTIYELPDLIKNSDEFSSQFPEELFFTSDFSSLKPDIILFGSSLQYFENYREVISQVTKLNAKAILLTDHPMGIVPTFVCAQVNMANRIIPRFVFNKDEIINLFNESDYDLAMNSLNYFSFHNFENYEGDYKNCHHTNLIFKRKE